MYRYLWRTRETLRDLKRYAESQQVDSNLLEWARSVPGDRGFRNARQGLRDFNSTVQSLRGFKGYSLRKVLELQPTSFEWGELVAQWDKLRAVLDRPDQPRTVYTDGSGSARIM
jgi:hypothetical protein